MTTPHDLVYPKIHKGYSKKPSSYDTCKCGKLKKTQSPKCWDCHRLSFLTSIEQPEDPSYRFIALSRGQYAIVDTFNYEWLMQWKWFARWNSHVKSFYASRNSSVGEGQRCLIHMHRVILGLSSENQTEVDHENHNTLDNCLFINGIEQLRLASPSENRANSLKSSSNTSGYKGVCFAKDRNNWYARITFMHKTKFLGYFASAELAYAAYCAASETYHGNFACLG